MSEARHYLKPVVTVPTGVAVSEVAETLATKAVGCRVRERPPEPLACEDCGAVFRNGRWQWIDTRELSRLRPSGSSSWRS